MIDDACVGQSKHRHAPQGLNASQIANALALAPRPVAYGRAPEPFRPSKPSTRHSQLDPVHKDIVRRLARYPYAAAQVFQRLCAHGFDGGDALVKA